MSYVPVAKPHTSILIDRLFEKYKFSIRAFRKISLGLNQFNFLKNLKFNFYKNFTLD